MPRQFSCTSFAHCFRVCQEAVYLVDDIVERVRAVDGVADEDDVCLRVRQRSQSVIVFLSCWLCAVVDQYTYNTMKYSEM